MKIYALFLTGQAELEPDSIGSKQWTEDYRRKRKSETKTLLCEITREMAIESLIEDILNFHDEDEPLRYGNTVINAANAKLEKRLNEKS